MDSKLCGSTRRCLKRKSPRSPQGASVAARATAWPGQEFSGRVLAILPDVDAQSRTLPVRIEIQNPDRKLAPGMFVSLDLNAAPGEPVLVAQ